MRLSIFAAVLIAACAPTSGSIDAALLRAQQAPPAIFAGPAGDFHPASLTFVDRAGDPPQCAVHLTARGLLDGVQVNAEGQEEIALAVSGLGGVELLRGTWAPRLGSLLRLVRAVARPAPPANWVLRYDAKTATVREGFSARDGRPQAAARFLHLTRDGETWKLAGISNAE